MNQQEFEHIFRTHYAAMLHFATVIVKSADEAKDVVSDVMEQLWQDQLTLPEGKERAMLLTCVRNRCITLLNRQTMKQRVHQRITLETSSTVGPLQKDPDTEHRQIRRIIDTCLSDREREVIRMKFDRKMKYREMAADMQISETAVYKHLAHALNKIKNELNDGNRG
jgi:RNA polymerase sigma-70 factor (ECF subfamily)